MISTKKINQWFISPNSENFKYVNYFFKKIVEQLLEEKSKASWKELVPECSEDQSFINELENSHNLEQILEKLKVIYNQSMNASSTGYIGQMDSIPNLGTIIGDLVSAAVNNNMLANEMSPILSWLEVNILKKFIEWFGFGDNAGGVMTSGGSLANIQALTIARNTKLNIPDGNVFNLKNQPVIFTSEHSHTSILKAGMLLGIGINNVVKIKIDCTGRMSIEDLRRQIDLSIQTNKLPFAVVSTFGTTNSGSLDDVDTIQSICDEYNLWHHVDAIYGGALTLSLDHKHICPTFSKADSLSFNPQKWMYVSKTCSILIVKKIKLLDTHFKISAPYVQKDDKINLGEYGIQGSRHTSILKLWLSLYLIGKNGYEDIINQNLCITRKFADWVKSNRYYDYYTYPELNIILFRPIYSLSNQKIAATELQNYLIEKENIYVCPINFEGKIWLKTIFLNPYFNETSLERFIKILENYRIKNIKESINTNFTS